MKPTYGDTLRRNSKHYENLECKHNLFQQSIKKDDQMEYHNDEAIVAGRFMSEIMRIAFNDFDLWHNIHPNFFGMPTSFILRPILELRKSRFQLLRPIPWCDF